MSGLWLTGPLLDLLFDFGLRYVENFLRIAEFVEVAASRIVHFA